MSPDFPGSPPNATHQSHWCPQIKDIAGICLSPAPTLFPMRKEDQGSCPLPSTPSPIRSPSPTKEWIDPNDLPHPKKLE